MLNQLPPESGYMTALREAAPDYDPATATPMEGHGRWSNMEMLAAAIVDGINILAWQNVAMNTEKGKSKPPPPSPVRRPGVKEERTINNKARNALMDKRERIALQKALAIEAAAQAVRNEGA